MNNNITSLKKLLIVESPNKIKTIQQYLGEDFEILATFGHIRDLPLKELGVDINNNFTPRYALLPDKVGVLQKILDAANRADVIYCGSDLDAEGEAISFSLLYYLQSLKKPIYRIAFNEITNAAILKAIENPKGFDENLYKSQQFRRIIDRLTGFKVSPLLSKVYKESLSAGRVQSVVVKLIQEREAEIEKFKPKESFHLNAIFQRKNKETFTAKLDLVAKTLEQAEQLKQLIINESNFLVAEIKASQKQEKPYPPLITITLQQLMAKKEGFPADKTLNLAQRLFENGLITYIRTDSPRISEEAMAKARDFLKNKFPLPKKGIQYSSAKSQADAHEALRPTNSNLLPAKLFASEDEKKVYKAIWEQFLASQLTNAIWNVLQVKITGENNKSLIFKLSGKALQEPGWKAIFGTIAKEKIEIPFLKEKEVVAINPKSVKIEKKVTSPPARFNDATILKELEARNLGRPATVANIIKTITNRNYVEKKSNTFYITDKGREVVGLLNKFFGKGFMDIGFTAKCEDQLDQIAEGKVTPNEMLKLFYTDFSEQMENAEKKLLKK